MFTVIIKSKRSSDLLRDYKFLFKPFVDNGTLAFCDWNESGTDVRSSVPDLYNLVKGKKEWRAIILNNDSVYDYHGCFRPHKQNPFDYAAEDLELLPHESPIPIIRLTHIIGGYSAAPLKEFEKGFEFVDEDTGEKTRVREADLTEDQIQEMSVQYCDSLTPVYIEKECAPEISMRQAEMQEKYAFTDTRPTEILLVATKKKVESNDKTRIIESWKNHLEMTSSTFWERNKYPNNCRFLFYNLTNTDNSMYTKELAEFWLSVLTLAINKIAASTLQAYRLYNLRVDVSREELERTLNLHLNRMTSAYTFIKEQLKLKPEYSFSEDEEITTRQVIPVALEKKDGSNLLIDLRRIGLSRDCPEDEQVFWQAEVRAKRESLDRFLKQPRRAIDKAAGRLKLKALSFVGEEYELDRFQMDDLRETMADLEGRIISSEATNTIDKKIINRRIEEVNKKVRREIDNRLRRSHVLAAAGAAALLVLAGFLPYLIESARISGETFGAALSVVGASLAFVMLGGLIVLLVQRGRMVSIMKDFNRLMRVIANDVRDYATRFETYFSDICTYMKAKSILNGINEGQANALSTFSILNIHRQALLSAIARDNEWGASYGIHRVDEVVPTVTSFFNSDIAPRENPLYYFEANSDERDIPINSTGDYVTSPYKFVEKLWVEREDVFDEEEAVK